MSETILDHGYLPEEHAPDPVIGHGDPTAPGKIGDSVERLSGGAEASDQLAIGDRADARGPDQPQAVGEVFDPTRGSVPFVRRRMFSRCFHSTRRAKPSSIGTSDERSA